MKADIQLHRVEELVRYYRAHPDCSEREILDTLDIPRGTVNLWLGLLRGKEWARNKHTSGRGDYGCSCGAKFINPSGLKRHRGYYCMDIIMARLTKEEESPPNGEVKVETSPRASTPKKEDHTPVCRAPTFKEIQETIIATFEGAVQVPELKKDVVRLGKMLVEVRAERDLFEKQLREQQELSQRYRLVQQQGEMPGGRH